MKTLNISNNQIAGIHGIIDRLGDPLISLDVSSNILGTLGINTFAKLINLEVLVLRNTSLTTIQFGLFHHQEKLQLLDISYNNLKKIQFKVFSRNLINLESFFVDGNNLTNVDGLQKQFFSKVRVLGISNNNFTCEYLVDFLAKWEGVELVKDEWSNQSHVEMIACDKQFISHFVQGETATIPTSTIPTPTTSISSTPASTTTTSATTSSNSPTSKSPTSKSPTSNSPTSNPPTNKTQSQQRNDVHEQYLSNIFIVLIIACVLLSLICIMVFVKYSISMCSNINRVQTRRPESDETSVSYARNARRDNLEPKGKSNTLELIDTGSVCLLR